MHRRRNGHHHGAREPVDPEASPSLKAIAVQSGMAFPFNTRRFEKYPTHSGEGRNSDL